MCSDGAVSGPGSGNTGGEQCHKSCLWGSSHSPPEGAITQILKILIPGTDSCSTFSLFTRLFKPHTYTQSLQSLVLLRLSVLLLLLPCLCITLDYLSCFDHLLPAYCFCLVCLDITCDCLMPALTLSMFCDHFSVLPWLLPLLEGDSCMFVSLHML